MLTALPCSKLRHSGSLLQLPGLVLLFNSFWKARLGSEASGLLKVAMDRQVGALPSIQEHLLTEFPPGKTELTAFLKSTTITCFSFILPSHKEMSPCGQKSLFSPQFIQLNGVEPGYEQQSEAVQSCRDNDLEGKGLHITPPPRETQLIR